MWVACPLSMDFLEKVRVMQQEQQPMSFEQKIGNTTYLVTFHFSETSKEDLLTKMERLLRQEALDNLIMPGQ